MWVHVYLDYVMTVCMNVCVLCDVCVHVYLNYAMSGGWGVSTCRLKLYVFPCVSNICDLWI